MGFANDYLYTGRRLDEETGLLYYRMRYYAAGLGRFFGRDPIGYNVTEWNLYLYATANPSRFIDPTGLLSVCCRRTQTGNWYDTFADHCQFRNKCRPGERSYPAWKCQRGGTLDTGVPCRNATLAQINACLRRNQHNDQPFGAPPTLGNNCQSSTIQRIARCCLCSSWEPQFAAGSKRGRCHSGHFEFVHDNSDGGVGVWICDDYESYGDWQQRVPMKCVQWEDRIYWDGPSIHVCVQWAPRFRQWGPSCRQSMILVTEGGLVRDPAPPGSSILRARRLERVHQRSNAAPAR